MSDVIDELRESYVERTSELSAVDVREALILGATEKGDGLRRVRRRRRTGGVALLVVVTIGATSVAIAARPDQRLRVGTTESTSVTPATSAIPVATDREFPDLGRLLKLLESEVATDAASPDAARAEVVHTTLHTLEQARGFQAIPAGSRDVDVYAVQLTGTTFVCHECASTGGARLTGRALLMAWDATLHQSRLLDMAAPIDLSRFGRVYQIVLRDRRPTVAPELCTQADLDGPGLAMPAPVRITSPVVLEPVPNYSHLDPAPGVVPKVSAAAAWSALTRNLPLPARSAQLLLGYYGTTLGGGVNHVLAWVLRVQHLAFDGFQGAATFGTGPTVPRPACEFTNAVLTLNADTGTGLVESYGG